MAEKAHIGVTGLAVMGRNLARNLARHGHVVAVHNRTPNRTKELIEEYGHEGEFRPAQTAEESGPSGLPTAAKVAIAVAALGAVAAIIVLIVRRQRTDRL